MNKILILVLASFLSASFFCQVNPKTDSLRAELRKVNEDTMRVKIYLELVSNWRFVNQDSAMAYTSLSEELSEKINFKYGLGRSYAGYGMVYSAMTKYEEAIDWFNKAAIILKTLNRKQELANTFLNIGWAYSSISNYPQALEYDLKALQLMEDLKDLKGKAIVLGNIGIIHYYNKNTEKAIKFTEEALEMDKKNKNESNVARHLGNLGTFYIDVADGQKKSGHEAIAKENYKTAFDKLTSAMNIYEAQNNKAGMAMQMGNIANVLLAMGDTSKTIECYKKAFEIDSAMGNKEGVSRNLGNIGWTYMILKNYGLAEKYMLRALAIGEEIQNIRLCQTWNSDITEVYERIGRHDLALKHFKAGIKLRDSIYNIENAKKSLETEMNFEFQKKEAIAKQESEKQALIRNVFIAGFAVMCIMAILILRSYRLKQKANKLVSQQKELLEVKNKEITDSIHYAKRIQNAHLPNHEYIAKKLTELKKKT